MSRTLRRTWWDADPFNVRPTGTGMYWTRREKSCQNPNCPGCQKGVWHRAYSTRARRQAKQDINNQLTKEN